MLFNPNWNKSKSTPKPAVISLDGLIAWLEGQPRDQYYEYLRTEHCLLAQYFRSQGYRDVSVGAELFSYVGGFFGRRRRVSLAPGMNYVANRCCTFGDALALAKVVKLKEAKVVKPKENVYAY